MLKFLLTVQELKCSSLVALSCKVHLSVAHFWRATMCCIYGNQPTHACGPAADLDVMHTHTRVPHAHTHTHGRTHTHTHTCTAHTHTHTWDAHMHMWATCTHTHTHTHTQDSSHSQNSTKLLGRWSRRCIFTLCSISGTAVATHATNSSAIRQYFRRSLILTIWVQHSLKTHSTMYRDEFHLKWWRWCQFTPYKLHAWRATCERLSAKLNRAIWAQTLKSQSTND